jgi:hypothetical protein
MQGIVTVTCVVTLECRLQGEERERAINTFIPWDNNKSPLWKKVDDTTFSPFSLFFRHYSYCSSGRTLKQTDSIMKKRLHVFVQAVGAPETTDVEAKEEPQRGLYKQTSLSSKNEHSLTLSH